MTDSEAKGTNTSSPLGISSAPNDGSKVKAETAPRSPLWLKTLGSGLILALVANTLYDLVVKSGITAFGRFLLNVITLGSEFLRNAAYSSAALDPQPVSGVLLLLMALAVGLHYYGQRLSTAVSSYHEIKDRLARLRDPQPSEPEPSTEEPLKTREKNKQGLVRLFTLARVILRLRLGLFLAFLFGATLVLTIHNQSVLIWRSFQTDLTILVPRISAEERNELLARFAAMETRDEHQAIRMQMDQLAAQKGVHLKNIETW